MLLRAHLPVFALTGLVALGCALVLTLPRLFWRGDWFSGVHSLDQVMVLSCVPLAAVSAWVAGSGQYGALADLVQLPASRGRVRLTRWVVTWAPLGVVYALSLAALLVTTVLHEGSPSWNVMPQATTVAGIMFASAAGQYAGHYLPGTLGAATCGALAMFLVFPTGLTRFTPLSTPSPTAQYAGTTPAVDHYTLALLVLVALTLLLLVAPRPTRRWPAGPSLTVACLAVVLLVVSGSGGEPDEYEATGGTPTRCTSATVDVCVFPGYDRSVIGVVAVAERLLASAQEQGIAQDLFARRLEQHGFQAGVTDDGVGRVTDFWWRTDSLHGALQIADGLIRPTDCQNGNDAAMTSPPRYLESMYDAAYWLASEADYLPRRHLDSWVSPTFQRVPVEDRAGYVRRVLEDLERCRL